MSQQILYPQWQNQNEGTRYPFAASATLTNGSQTILEGTFLDAAFYPIGGKARTYLSSIVAAHETITIYVGDPDTPQRLSVTFTPIAAPATLRLVDTYGREGGIIVTSRARLLPLTAWGVGTFTFTPDQTEFSATVCMPRPEICLQGFLLPDGTLVSGNVWLIGSDGVVLSATTAWRRQLGASSTLHNAVRIDVVGDPLFRRRNSELNGIEDTPTLIKTLVLRDANGDTELVPDSRGGISIFVNNGLVADTILRLWNTETSLAIGIVGSTTAGT